MRRFVYCKVVLATSLMWVLVDVFLLLYFSECNKCDDKKERSLLPALRGECSWRNRCRCMTKQEILKLDEFCLITLEERFSRNCHAHLTTWKLLYLCSHKYPLGRNDSSDPNSLRYLPISTIPVSSEGIWRITWGMFWLDRISSLGSKKPVIFKDQAHNTGRKY